MLSKARINRFTPLHQPNLNAQEVQIRKLWPKLWIAKHFVAVVNLVSIAQGLDHFLAWVSHPSICRQFFRVFWFSEQVSGRDTRLWPSMCVGRGVFSKLSLKIIPKQCFSESVWFQRNWPPCSVTFKIFFIFGSHHSIHTFPFTALIDCSHHNIGITNVLFTSHHTILSSLWLEHLGLLVPSPIFGLAPPLMGWEHRII